MPRYIDAETALKIIDNYAKTVTADGKVVVDAIRDIVGVITPTADVVPKSEVEKWVDRCRDWHEVGELKCQEIERLHGILLQFTDLVHKWGAKNNIDTSEISLVPILQEEADSIIKKANQAFAREIFEEIDDIFLMFKPQYFVDAPHLNYKRLTDLFAKAKQKYTEGNQ